MSKNKIQLNISKPCHENWYEMTREEQSRFCNTCQKSVFDFTKFSNKELYHYFNDANINTCGRFKVGQLDAVLSQPPRFSLQWFKSSFAAASFVAFFTLPKVAMASNVKATTHQKESQQRNQPGVLNNKTELVKLIKGRLTDQNDRPLAGTVVKLEGTSIKAKTDDKGCFMIDLPDGFNQSRISLTAIRTGYASVTKTFDLQKSKSFNIMLETVYELMGEVVVVKKN